MSKCPHCEHENDLPNIKIDSDNSTEGDNYEIDCENCEALYWVTYTVTDNSWCKHEDHVWESWHDGFANPDCTKECQKCGSIMAQAVIDMEDKFYRENK